MQRVDDLLVWADPGGLLRVVDLAELSSPVQVSSLELEASDLAPSDDNWLYVATSEGLSLLDLSDARLPRLIALPVEPFPVLRLARAGDRLVALAARGHRNAELWTFALEADDPLALTLVTVQPLYASLYHGVEDARGLVAEEARFVGTSQALYLPLSEHGLLALRGRSRWQLAGALSVDASDVFIRHDRASITGIAAAAPP